MEGLFGLAVFEGTDCQRYCFYIADFDSTEFDKDDEVALHEAIVKIKEAVKADDDEALRAAFSQFLSKYRNTAGRRGVARLKWIEKARAIKWQQDQAEREAWKTKAERRKKTAKEKASEAEWEKINAARDALMAKGRAERRAERKAERETAKANAAKPSRRERVTETQSAARI